MVALSLGLGYFYWDTALDWVRGWLESSDLIKAPWGWLQGVGAGNLKTVVAPLIVIFAVTPLIVLLSLLLVAAFMAPGAGRAGGAAAFPAARAQARRFAADEHRLVAGLHRCWPCWRW